MYFDESYRGLLHWLLMVSFHHFDCFIVDFNYVYFWFSSILLPFQHAFYPLNVFPMLSVMLDVCA